MRAGEIASLVFRLSAIAVTLIFVGGASPLASTAVMVVGVTECFPQASTLSGLDQWGGLFLLGLLLIILIAVGVERWVTLAQAMIQSRAFERRALTALFYNRVEEIESSAILFPESPVAMVVTASLPGSTGSNPGQARISRRHTESGFQRALMAQTLILRKRLWTLAAIGWSSPVIGLIAALGPSSSRSFDPPLSLILGLAIAVPAIWLHCGLRFRADTLLLAADKMSRSIIDQIKEQAMGCDGLDVSWVKSEDLPARGA